MAVVVKLSKPMGCHVWGVFGAPPILVDFRAPRAGLACPPRGLDGWTRWMADKRERGSPPSPHFGAPGVSMTL